MPGIPKHGKRDLNEGDIKKALIAVGAAIVPLSIKGVPDLLVGFRGINYLLEIKGDDGKLTDDEFTFFEIWEGQCCVVRTPEEALKAIGAINA